MQNTFPLAAFAAVSLTAAYAELWVVVLELGTIFTVYLQDFLEEQRSANVAGTSSSSTGKAKP